MKKSDLRARWSNNEYLAAVQPTLVALFDEKVLRSEADLRGMTVGLDGAIKPLEFASFDQATVEFVNLSLSRLSCSFGKCDFRQVVLDDSVFDTCNFSGSRFSDCSFRSTRLTAPTMDDALFLSSDFSEARFIGRRSREYGGRRTVFDGCSFRGTQLKALELRACRFINCRFDGALFERCDLRGVNFENCGTHEDQFVECNLSGAAIA